MGVIRPRPVAAPCPAGIRRSAACARIRLPRPGVLTYISGEVGQGDRLIPDQGGRFDHRLPAFVWRDDALVHLGVLLRGYHDAAATILWTGREWCFEAREPVETICHNELKPSNTVFRSDVPVALIDWDTAAPGPRAWDLGFAAWFWVPFWRDEKCRAAGLPTGIAEKACRFRLLLDAYGLEPDMAIVSAGVERMSGFLGHIRQLAAEGSEHDVLATRRGAVGDPCGPATSAAVPTPTWPGSRTTRYAQSQARSSQPGNNENSPPGR